MANAGSVEEENGCLYHSINFLECLIYLVLNKTFKFHSDEMSDAVLRNKILQFFTLFTSNINH